MLRWSGICRIVKITKYPRSFASTSAAGVDAKSTEQPEKPKIDATEQSKMVAAAFTSLKELSVTTKRHPASSVDTQIAEAADVNALLSIAENYVSKHHALKIVSKLADWASMNKIKIADFESDIRYARICRSLGHPGTGQDLGDLSVVLGVTADEQAAKLISSISLPQMIKVMTSLGIKGRRSTPLLRSLSFNIGRSTETLDSKQVADVFYSCAVLNFPDEILLAKVTADLASSLKTNKTPSVVSSIATSAGILKYRDTELFENLCNWVVENHSSCRIKEYISLVLALASVNYIPSSFSRIHKKFKPFLNESEMENYQDWLDVVWSLVVLQMHNKDLLQSVLTSDFINKLALQNGGDVHIVTKMKLLNINSAAQLLGSDYDGVLLPENSNIYNVPLVRTKEKQLFVDCVKDSISNLFDISQHFKSDVNTGMGFLIDFECRLNSRSQPVKITEWSAENLHKVAIMVCNYHDVCRGTNEKPHGRTALYYRLLESNDYKLLVIPFYEFSMRDKLITRVQYLENKFKNLVSRS